ncbi:PIN domain-containing protein [Atopobiaceae bacterium 24-176]
MLDTNVLTDLIMMREPWAEAAMGLIDASQRRACELLVSALALKDASYIVEESKYAKRRIPDRSKRREIAFKGRELMLSTCEICNINEIICRRANANRNEPDYDDALVAECALVNGANAIVSRDKRAFNELEIPKLSPIDALKLVRASSR